MFGQKQRPATHKVNNELETLFRKQEDLLNQIESCKAIDELKNQQEKLEKELKIVQNQIMNAITRAEEKGSNVPAAVPHSSLSSRRQTLTEEKKEAAPLAAAMPEVSSGGIVYYNPTSRKVRAQPIYVFTEDEQKLMQDYFAKGDDLDDAAIKPLIEAAIMDGINLELNFFPASVIPEGLVDYSFKWLEEYFATPHPFFDSNGKKHPTFQKAPTLDVPCTKDDVLPCNTLLRALKLFLEKAKKWEDGDKTEPAVPELKQLGEKRQYTALTQQEVEILETIYRHLSSSRQLMFNCIVRDHTNQIINKAVQLPDGYVYDESLVEKLLVCTSPPKKFPAIYEGHCPDNQEITFKVVRDESGKDLYSEIKPVAYYGRVVDLLKINAARFVNVVNAEDTKPLKNADLSHERDDMLLKLAGLLEKIEKTPLIKTANEQDNAKYLAIQKDQIAVIQAAIKALKHVDAKEFKDAIEHHSSFAAVKTKLSGFNEGKSTISKFYRGVAYAAKTIDKQVGVMMPTVVERVQDLLTRCENDLNPRQNLGNRKT